MIFIEVLKYDKRYLGFFGEIYRFRFRVKWKIRYIIIVNIKSFGENVFSFVL